MSADSLDTMLVITAIGASVVLALIFLVGMKRPRQRRRQVLAPEASANSGVRWIIIFAWAASTLPSLIQNLTTTRRANAVVDVAASTGLSTMAAYLTAALLIALCLWQLLTAKVATDTLGLLGVGLLLAPWMIAMLSSAESGSNIPFNALALPAVAFALWRLNAKLQDLTAVAWLTGCTAAIALVMGLLAPTRGLLHGSSGYVSTADKAIIGDTLLAGPFNHSNQLGVILALGLPAILLLHRRSDRFWIFAVTVLALAWSASRGSLLAVGVFLVACWWVTRFKNASPRRFWSFVVVVPSLAAVAYVPLVTDDLSAFSDRGQIWAASMAAWAESPSSGNGYAWYSEIAKVANDLTAVAFNGHNLFVHALATGGVLLLVALVLLCWRLVSVSIAEAGVGNIFPLAYTVCFGVLAILEVPTRFRDVDPQSWVAVLPVVIIAMWKRVAPPESTRRGGAALLEENEHVEEAKSTELEH